MFSSSKKGFTLVEIIIVISIIGILSLISIPLYSSFTDRAQFAGQLKDMGMMKSAIELHQGYLGYYPIANTSYSNLYGCYGSPVNKNWIPGIVEGGYISELPKQPPVITPNCDDGQLYIYSGDSTGYQLLSHGKKMAKMAKNSRPDLLDPNRPQHAWRYGTFYR